MIYTALELKFYLENRKPENLPLKNKLKYKKSSKHQHDRYKCEKIIEISESIYYAHISLNNIYIRIYFGESGTEYHRLVNGSVIADRNDCFDKLTKCCLRMNFPFENKDLFDNLRFLTSNEGYKYSNEYQYLDPSSRRIPFDD